MAPRTVSIQGDRGVDADIEELVVRLAKENKSWGYDRIAGALANLGHEVADQTVGNILKRHGIPLAPERRKTTTWREFIRSHMDVLAATDFFTTEVWTQGGLVTYYVLFFIHLATRRVHVAGITPHPNEQWMTQVARNVTMADVGFLSSSRYLIHDRDTKFCQSFHRGWLGQPPAAGCDRLPARGEPCAPSRTSGQASQALGRRAAQARGQGPGFGPRGAGPDCVRCHTRMWDGFLLGKRYLIHDRDPLFTEAVRGLLRDSGVKPLRLPANSGASAIKCW